MRAVLFDIDGTLVDSNEQHVNAWAFAFQDEGYPQERDDIRAQIGKGGDLLVPALVPNLAEETRERIADRHADNFKSMYLDHVHPFDDAAALVRAAYERGWRVALASSAKQKEVDHYIDLLDIRDAVAATTSIDEVDASKPEPDIFGAALSKLGVAPEDAIAVGDTPYDVEAARRAGVVTIGVISGPFDEEQLSGAGAIAVFRDVADLLKHWDHSPLGANWGEAEPAPAA
jgi:HAD superfamily hydrolase (TIGR01549 family)